MIKHFVSSGMSNVRYKIFIHVGGDSPSPRNVNLCEISSARNSRRFKNLNETIDAVAFDEHAFQRACVLEFGPPLDELRATVVEAFKSTSLSEDSIDTLFYPNAINLIAESSTQEKVSFRTFTKPRFLEILADIRKTAISRWTLALKTRQTILRTRQAQLRTNLSKNSRKRCLIIAQNTVAEFENGIVLFIQDFIGKYHFKPNHEKPPTFYLDCNEDLFSEIRLRLHQKNIRFTTGTEINEFFDLGHFLREPVTRVINGNQVQSDFQIRITCHNETHDLLRHKGFDDVYVISNSHYSFWEQDVEIEALPVDSFEELAFLLGLSRVVT